MPAIYPNSYGAREPQRPLREYNPCHEPGGKPTGGQFAPKGSNGCTSTGGEPRQKKLFDKAQMQKFHVRSTGDKRGLTKEPPELKPHAPPSDDYEGHRLSSFSDDSNEGNADDALSFLGVSMSAEDIAAGMVSRIKGERFEVTVTARGARESTSYDGPDPDDVRSEYDDWSMEMSSEQENSLWVADRADFLFNSERAYYKAGLIANEAMGGRELADESEWHAKDVVEHTEALAERLFDPDSGVITTEGRLEVGSGGPEKRIRDIVEQYVDEHPDAKFRPFPREDSDDPTVLLDRDYRLAHSKYFNDDEGQSNWLDDSMHDGRVEVDSFDTWYENRYGHSPDKYGEYGEDSEYDSDTAVEFEFRGSEGTRITRTFSLRDGELHVHHDYFTANTTGDGVGKALFQGSLPIYDKMGVKHLSTLANIDVGSYAWARFGFHAQDPYSLAQTVETRAKKLFRDTGLLDDNDWDRFTSLIDKTDGRFVWDIADAKYYTTSQKATELFGAISRGRTEVFKKKYLEEAAKGVVSLGRVLMVDMSGWNAFLDLHDERSVKRLESYVGVWRKGRQTPTGPSRADRIASALATVQPRTKGPQSLPTKPPTKPTDAGWSAVSPSYRAKVQQLDKKLARARAETKRSGGKGTEQSRALVKSLKKRIQNAAAAEWNRIVKSKRR